MESLFSTYSDLFKEVYGFRPRHQMSVTEVLEALPRLRKEAEELSQQEQVENDTLVQDVFFEGQPVRKGDWDDPEKWQTPFFLSI